MQFTTILSVAFFVLGVTAVSGPNGKRTCVFGAINCKYRNHRCANFCSDGGNKQTEGGFINTDCSCPAGTSSDPYIGAGCINVATALGRHNC
ncbi:hypothetical protein EJ02DRAFT_459521 [Clathrospora elynae]|uniref:Uncharacterized protein n=1 Tax=Clathrospora elynae TaxID=706981 RepID=A0A6A5SDA8_9PLEO|nr:hypothetical protein EJ02DRAFT_459521 [Clathrospora elynae]